MLREWWLGHGRAKRRDFVLAAVLAVVCMWLYGAGNARYGLFDVDEAIFTQATVEMRHSGSLAMPTYNGEPRYHKPPLIYWLQDASMSVLGEGSLYAARLPSIMAALLTIAALGFGVWHLTRDRRWALTAAMVMALNLSFLVVGRAATADGLLNLTSLLLALWVLHVCFPPPAVLPRLEEEGRKAKASKKVLAERVKQVNARATYWRWQWLVTGLLGAFGFVAKGPVAWLPAAFIVLALLWARRDKADIWRRVAPVKSGLLTLALLVPWVALLVNQHGVGFFYEFIVVHNLGRYAGGLSNTQSSSPFYYLLVLLLGFFPWVLLLPAAVRHALRGGLRGLKTALASRDVSRALPALALVWAVVYVLFFSFSQTKLAHYIVPAYPALAVLVGWHLSRVPRARLGVGYVGLGVFIGLLLALLMLVLDPLLLGLRDSTLHGWLGWLQAALDFTWPPKDKLAQAVLAQNIRLDVAPYLIGVLMMACMLPAWVMVGRARKGAELVLGTAWALCLAFIVWGVVPMVWAYTQAPLARLAMVIGNEPASTPVVHLGMHKPSVRYLSQKPFLKLEKPLQLPDYLQAAETLVLTEQPTVPAIALEVATKGNAQILGQRCDGGYCLLVVARPLPPADIPALTPAALVPSAVDTLAPLR
jgi:4-amino-4-deoxy-L-arabinose transferase-like glycosyltransferase